MQPSLSLLRSSYLLSDLLSSNRSWKHFVIILVWVILTRIMRVVPSWDSFIEKTALLFLAFLYFVGADTINDGNRQLESSSGTTGLAETAVMFVQSPSGTRDAQEDRCAVETSDLVSCYSDIGAFKDYCDRCVAQALPATTDSCDSLNEIMCNAVDICPCGLCSDEIRSFLNCAFQVKSDTTRAGCH